MRLRLLKVFTLRVHKALDMSKFDTDNYLNVSRALAKARGEV